MATLIILANLLIATQAASVSVSMIPNTGTPPSVREIPGFALEKGSNKLYVYGGRYESPLDDMWEFDLSTETWREIHSTSSINPGARSDPYLFTKEPGKLLLYGGNSKSGPVSDLWEFDIANLYVIYMQWKLVNTIGNPPRSAYRSATYYEQDDKSYLAVYGGFGEKESITNLYILNLETYTWSKQEANGPKSGGGGMAYYDDNIYMWESDINEGSSKARLWKNDLNDKEWSVVETSGPEIEYLRGNGLCGYEKSLFLINGFQDNKGQYQGTIYRVKLDSEKKVWEESMDIKDNYPKAASGYICSENTVYIFGGASYKGTINQLLKINLEFQYSDAFELSKSMTVPTARYGHAMEVYDEKLHILGGTDIYGNDLIDMYTFDLKTEAWESQTYKSSYAPTPRSEFAHTRMGEILIIFGGTSNSNLLGDMHYFNLRTQEWKAVEPKSTDNPTIRKGSCMAAAGNTIFIFGGITNQGYTNELWMFDSGTSTYTLLKSLGDTPSKSARGNCRAYTDVDNQIIFETYLGESVGRAPLSTIYQYKLSYQTWYVIKNYGFSTIYPSQASSIYFKNKLLIAGGNNWGFTVTDDINIYDIKTGTYNKLIQKLPHMVYNAASVYYKNKLYIHGGAASFLTYPLSDIPINDLIVIELSDDCNDSPELCNNSCSSGTYVNNENCESCPEGTYQDEIGAIECKKCPAGFYSDTEGADSIRFCKPCSQGTYNVQEGETKCYTCPSGNECSLSIVQSSLETSQMIKTGSDQPDIYSTKEDEVEEISYIFDLVLATVSSFTIVMLLLFLRTRKILTNLDLFTIQHNYDLDTPLVAKKTFIGGVASSIFFVIGVSILVNMSLAYGLDNVTETKALVPLVALEQEYGSFYAEEVEIEFTFTNYGGECKIVDKNTDFIHIDMDNFEGDITNMSFEKDDTLCIVSFKILNCELINTGSLTLTMLEDESYANDIYITISSSSSIPGEYSTIKTVVSTSDSNKYFRGPDPSIVNLLMTPSLFLTDTGDWDNELKGYHISELSDPKKGSEIEYSEVSFIKNLRVTINFEKNTAALQTQRLEKQSLITFFGNLAGSILGILGAVGFVMGIVEQVVKAITKTVNQRRRIAYIMKTREDLFDLHFNENPKASGHTKADTSLLTKPYDHIIDDRQSGTSIQDQTEDSKYISTLGLDNTNIFIRRKFNQVVPIDSIKTEYMI